jgi:hypothetical protein
LMATSISAEPMPEPIQPFLPQASGAMQLRVLVFLEIVNCILTGRIIAARPAISKP